MIYVINKLYVYCLIVERIDRVYIPKNRERLGSFKAGKNRLSNLAVSCKVNF